MARANVGGAIQSPQEWLSLREAARRLGIRPMQFYRVLEASRIRVRRLPGLDPRYSAEDVEALAASSVTQGPWTRKGRHP